MFFESSYYASPHIEDLLKKDDVQLVEFLDDDEILQEYKSQNKNLVQFFHRPDIVEQLVTMIITEPPGNMADAVRFKHPNIACEILTTETPDMTERLIENQPVLQKLYSFVEQDAPLNPLLTSFFSKTFGMLIVKKTEQNWFAYQCVCIQVLEFIKTRERFLETMFKHVGTPAIMDLLFQIIVNVEGPDLKNNLFNWLNEQNMVPRLINILGCDSDPEKHHNVAQFVCDLITHSRSFRQSDLVERGAHKQQDDAGMSLLHALEAPMVTSSLLEIVLMDTNKESTIVAGIRIVLKLLEKPVINERDISIAQMVQLAEDDHRNRLLGRLLPQVAMRVRDFHRLLQNPPARAPIQNTVALLQPPFGNTRLQVCIMLTVLLRTGHPLIERAICETGFFVTLIDLFKQYCWNNLLHNQVRTCLVYALTPSGVGDSPISALQTHIISKCKMVTKLIDCWKHNNEQARPSQKRGARLGYMGQLIDIFDVLTASCRLHDAYRALVEDSLTADQLADWHQIVGTPATSSVPAVAVEATAAADATAAVVEPSSGAGAETVAVESVPSSSLVVTPTPSTVAAVPLIPGELDAELRLQRTLLAGIDPYEKNESIFLTTDYDQDFNVDPEASERFAQACKSKDMNSADIDDILSDMLNIEDCDLFAMNDDDDATSTVVGSGANNRHHHLHDFDYDRGGSGSDDDYEPHRIAGNGFDDDDDEDEDDDDDDDDDDDEDHDDDNRRHRRRLAAGLQPRRPPTTGQLIIDSSDDNANVHSVDNLKFTSSFDISPWDTPSSTVGQSAVDLSSTSFFSSEVNFQAHFPDLSAATGSNVAAASSSVASLGGVSAVFDPIDPFGAFASGGAAADAEPFVFDAAVAFGDFGGVAATAATLGAAAEPILKDGVTVAAAAVVDAVDVIKQNGVSEIVAGGDGKKVDDKFD